MEPWALDDHTALVTGAGAGLGFAVALAFAAAGARVVAVSLRPAELDELCAAAEQRGLHVDPQAADVGDAAQAEAVAQHVLERYGAPDTLVNNAGIIVVAPIEETSVEEYDRVLATNLRGPFLYCRAFVPAMRARGSGTIINVSSASGVMGFTGESAYCPSKYGLEGLTQTLALELEGSGVRVTSVSPGALMHTPMSETTYDAAARARWVDPAVIAPGFLHLATTPKAISGGRFDAYAVALRGVEDHDIPEAAVR